ncbi:hypothetical protein PQ455_10460 [Sphingomonas naphthae]|uniref:DUF2730 family protein n=1 Tax=Sphingomonas naphthae TaxID=1813468 RepID=A0ABY7TI06_9SPHN|nr:hypothetical protein [Sphingomonas naphthae]WCT72070.1 hypothetical protein PQ455_10460 [Sphingomonas naphthae]
MAILTFVGISAFRGGKSNPVGTGALQRQLNTIGGEVRELKGKLKGFARTSEVETLRGEIRAMEARVASSGEVVALEGQIMALRSELQGAVKAADRTEAGVARIEGYFLERGIKGQ